MNLNQLNVVERVLQRVKKEKKEMLKKTPSAPCKTRLLDIALVGTTVNIPSAFNIDEPAAQNKNNKKGNTMYRDHDSYTPSLATLEIGKREYLTIRLDQIRDKKQTLLREKFGMNNPEGPKTFGELKKFIEEGRLQINEKYTKKFKDETELDRWSSPLNYLTFVDPSIKRDEKGFEEASKALYDAYNLAMDMIMVHDPIAGHEALKNFESQQF